VFQRKISQIWGVAGTYNEEGLSAHPLIHPSITLHYKTPGLAGYEAIKADANRRKWCGLRLLEVIQGQ